MSNEPNQELINHITKLLNSDTDCAHTRWAIALAHHNRLTVEDTTIEELDDLMSPDAETVGEWLEYLAEGEDTSVFTDNPQLFQPEADEKAAEETADQPFYDHIEVKGQHYSYDWSYVAENLTGPGILDYSDYHAGQWESYAARLLD